MSVTQMEQLQDQDQTFLDEKSKSVQQSKRNPPARPTSRFWFERFLAVIQRQNPSVIDANFLSQIAPSNESKLLSQLKFLHVIDEQARPTPLLSRLNMVGEEQKRGFQEIAKNSYQDLLSEINIDKAVPEDLVNYFIRKFSFTRDKGINATKFFLYLTEKGGMQVSSELLSYQSEKSNGAPAQNGLSPALVQRAPKIAPRDGRIGGRSLAQKKEVFLSGPSGIQATINITLDKDTPREYWDRVLALLGERKSEPNSIDIEGKREEEQSAS